MNKRARCGVAPPGDVFYAFRQTPTRSLSLFEYYKERRRKNRNEEGQNIRKTKKKSRVDRLVFNFLWVFCRLYAIIVVAYFTSSQLVCVCVCVLHVFMYVSLYTMLLEVVVVIMALSSRPEVNLLRVRKSL